MNYLEVCKDASGNDSGTAYRAFEGIKSVINGVEKKFKLEYPCHFHDEKRWFLLSATPLYTESSSAIVSHMDITDSKLVEEAQNNSEEKYHYLLMNMGNGFGYTERKSYAC